MEKKRRKYWEKKIYCEFGYKVGYLFNYIYLYWVEARDCCTFTHWIANSNGSPLLISSYEEACKILQDKNKKENFH